MSFILGNTVLLRWSILALLIIAMLGTWAFDQLNVPAQFPCEKPSVRLYGDFCGDPMSGFGALAWFSDGFFYTFNELIRGNIVPLLPNLIALLLACIIVFPFLSTLLLLAIKDSPRLQTLNLITWGLACLAILTMFILQFRREHFMEFFYLLWGLLLYALVAIGTIALEILALRATLKTSRAI